MHMVLHHKHFFGRLLQPCITIFDAQKIDHKTNNNSDVRTYALAISK